MSLWFLDEWLRMVTVGSVEFSWTSQLCQLMSQGFSVCYQLWAEKEKCTGGKSTAILSVSLVKHFLFYLLLFLPWEQETGLFYSHLLEWGLEKSFSLSSGADSRESQIMMTSRYTERMEAEFREGT